MAGYMVWVTLPSPPAPGKDTIILKWALHFKAEHFQSGWESHKTSSLNEVPLRV